MALVPVLSRSYLTKNPFEWAIGQPLPSSLKRQEKMFITTAEPPMSAFPLYIGICYNAY